MSDVPPRPRIRPATSDDWHRDRTERSGHDVPQGRDSAPSGAEFDDSTYYEYMQRHTGDFPVSRTRTALAAPYTPQSDTGPAGAPGSVPPELAHSAPPSKKRTGLKVVTVIVSIVIVLALLAFFGVRWLAPSTGTIPVDVNGSEGQTASPSPSEVLIQPSASPAEQLAGYADDGAKKATDLEGSWVTQLSAKKSGMQADGKSWSAQDILNEYEANRVKYPGAILIRSGDWGSYKDGGYLVTVIDTPYRTPDQALDQCRSWGLDRDHCLAKRLVKDGSHENNSAYLDG
ncbi:protein kinase [Brevibacterium sp.]|uniref:protein kinase n=1 Tax=Brevibacterium sp. TaxID=1701 RepID=UPI002810FA22|nr:protein kinase [Brevibacterium sp.]